MEPRVGTGAGQGIDTLHWWASWCLRRRLAALRFGSVVLSLLALGCRSPWTPSATVPIPDPCAFARGPQLQLGVSDEAALVRWIESQGAQPDKVAGLGSRPQTAGYTWELAGHRWFANLSNGRLVLITLEEQDSGPTFGQVVASWGTPDLVEGYVGLICERECTCDLGLEYLRLGLAVYWYGSVASQSVWQTGSPSLTMQEGLRVKEVYCFRQVDSIDAMLAEAFGATGDSLKTQTSMRSPWQGFGSLVPLGPR